MGWHGRVFMVCPALVMASSGVWAEDGWLTSGRVGVFGTSVMSHGAETSRDPAIKGTVDSTSIKFNLDTELEWHGGPRSLDQRLQVHYGSVHQAQVGWSENADEIRYDGVGRQILTDPQFLYVGWGLQSVFNGPPPERYAHDPTQVRVSSGYGLLYENLLPLKDKLEARTGIRSQKSWGPSLGEDQRDIETGPEGYLHYNRRVNEDLTYQAQYEIFAEFRDLAHVTQLATAGLDLALARHLTLAVSVRAFRESRPENRPQRTGYDEWSLRQETLLGLTYSW